jgi:hypothetical protein
MFQIRRFCLFAAMVAVVSLMATFCNAQCPTPPSNAPSNIVLTITPTDWAPGQSYNVTVVFPQPWLFPGSGTIYVITRASLANQDYFTEDPAVTVSNTAYVSSTELTFTVSVSSNAPTESDGMVLSCQGMSPLVPTVGTYFNISPCVNNPPTPVITSVSPSAYFVCRRANSHDYYRLELHSTQQCSRLSRHLGRVF